jgi:hypothetical protein
MAKRLCTSVSIYTDIDVDINEFDTKLLAQELHDRASEGDKDAIAALTGVCFTPLTRDEAADLEFHVRRGDRDYIDRFLRDLINASRPKPKLKAEQESAERSQ